MVVVGLDIGTQNIRVAVAEYQENDSFKILGTAKVKSEGLQKGVIVSIDSAMKKIREVIDMAEQNCGIEISDCIVSIGGGQIEGFNSRGQYAVSQNGKPKEITRDDVRKVIEVAVAIKIPADKEKLHVIPQIFTVDDISDIKDPVTRLGFRLEADVHIITTSRTIIGNLYSCVQRAGLDIVGPMLKTLAETYSSVQQDELDLGSIIIDLGAGSTDVLVVYNGAPVYTGSIPVCGYHVTSDIHLIKGISMEDAEKIKIQSGCCYPENVDPMQTVIIPGVGGRAPEEITQKELCNDIIYPRMAEIFEMVLDLLKSETTINKLNGNIILTGGGANIDGAVELCQEVFNTQNVRVGFPENFGGDYSEYQNPEWSTAIGLAISNNKISFRDNNSKNKNSFNFKSKQSRKTEKKDNIFNRIKKTFF